MVFPATPRGAAQYALNYGWETASLHCESSRVLNVNGNPCGAPAQVGYPSNYQAFPLTADLLLRWLGGGVYPAGFGVANVLAIYECDSASPLVDSLGLGPNLVAAGAPLTGRECVGLGQVGSFTSKVGVELLPGAAGQRFADAGAAFGNVAAGQILSLLLVFRISTRETAGSFNRLAEKTGATGYELDVDVGGNLVLYDTGGASGCGSPAYNFIDNAWHNGVVVFDCVTPIRRWLTDVGNGAPFGASPGAIASGWSFCLGSAASNSAGCQIAYAAFVNLEITSAMRANFWRHGLVHVPYLHARTNPLISPISPSRVAAWSGGNVGQAAVGYGASLVSAALGNPLGSGYVCEDGATFEPIGSDDLYTRTGVFGCAKTSVDGPSAMRDGVRITMAGAYVPGATFAYLPLLGVAIVGASNVPWREDVNYRRATVGTTARFGLQFNGDGGGPEYFTLITDNATPVDWTRGGGTCTPVGAAHNLCYVSSGAAANLDDCDFGEPAVIKNRATPSLTWRRVGTAAAAVTTTPAYLMVNTANRYYSPLRGRARVIIGNFQGTSGAFFLGFGLAGTAGALALSYNAGQLIFRIWDSASALVAALNCGAINTARHVIDVLWDSAVPIRGAAIGSYMVCKEGATILGEGGAVWAPPTAAVTPLAVGSDSGVTVAARAFVELAGIWSLPGSVQS